MNTPKWEKLKAKVLKAVKQRKSVQEIADEIGVKKTALSQQMCLWRKAGVVIPNMNTVPGNTPTERTINGVVYLYIKVNGNWSNTGRKDGQIVRRGPKLKPVADKVARKKTWLQKKYEAEKAERYRLKQIRIKEKELQAALKEDARVRREEKTKITEKKLTSRVVDESQYKYVTVCRGTTIQVLKTVSDEQAIENWYRKKEDSKVKWVVPKRSDR